MSDNPLTKKLLIKPNQRVAIINAPPGFIDQLGELPEGVTLTFSPEGTYDVVQIFAGSIEELNVLAPSALRSIRPDSVFWIAYPKQSAKMKTDLNRDSGWDAITQAGLRVVSLVAIDDKWASLRFRPTDQVVTKKKA